MYLITVILVLCSNSHYFYTTVTTVTTVLTSTRQSISHMIWDPIISNTKLLHESECVAQQFCGYYGIEQVSVVRWIDDQNVNRDDIVSMKLFIHQIRCLVCFSCAHNLCLLLSLNQCSAVFYINTEVIKGPYTMCLCDFFLLLKIKVVRWGRASFPITLLCR